MLIEKQNMDRLLDACKAIADGEIRFVDEDSKYWRAVSILENADADYVIVLGGGIEQHFFVGEKGIEMQTGSTDHPIHRNMLRTDPNMMAVHLAGLVEEIIP